MSVDERRRAAEQEDRRGPDYGQPHEPIQTCPHCKADLRMTDEYLNGMKQRMAKLGLTWVDPPFDPASPSNYTQGREGYVVHGAVIHTMVGSTASAVGAFKNPGRQASAHMLISEDGNELQMVDTDNGAWHCGRYYPDASHPLSNMTTVGFEHEDMGQYNSTRPDALYATSAKRLAMAATIHGFPLDENHVQPHRNVTMTSTACPDSLDWMRILTQAQAADNPTPVTKPEWQRNLKPVTVQTFKLIQPVTVLDLVTGAQRGTVPPGNLTVGFETTVGGTPYWVTTFGSTHGDGLKKSDVDGAIAPAPPPTGWKVSQQVKPFSGSFPTYEDAKVQTERYEAAKAVRALPKGTAVTVVGYSYADPPVQASDMGGGIPGLDYLWWHVADGVVTDARLDTSGVAGLPPAGKFDPLAPPVPVYSAMAPDNTPIFTDQDLNAVLAKAKDYQMRNRGTVVTITKDGTLFQTLPAIPPDGPPKPPPGAVSWLQALIDWLKKLFGA